MRVMPWNGESLKTDSMKPFHVDLDYTNIKCRKVIFRAGQMCIL